MTEEQQSYVFVALNILLRNAIVDIQFKKKDGSIRDMQVTLQESMLPPREYNEDGTEKLPHRHSTTTQVVYELETKQFKSFIKDNLINFSVAFTEEL